MPDEPLPLFLLNEVPHVENVKEAGAAFSKVVQQVEVKIARARLPQRRFKLSDSLFPAFALDPCRVFRGQLKGFTGVPLHQSLPDGVLAAGISPGRVEIGKTVSKKAVHHDFDLFHIYVVAPFGQTHQAEAQFFNFISQV